MVFCDKNDFVYICVSHQLQLSWRAWKQWPKWNIEGVYSFTWLLWVIPENFSSETLMTILWLISFVVCENIIILQLYSFPDSSLCFYLAIFFARNHILCLPCTFIFVQFRCLGGKFLYSLVNVASFLYLQNPIMLFHKGWNVFSCMRKCFYYNHSIYILILLLFLILFFAAPWLLSKEYSKMAFTKLCQ